MSRKPTPAVVVICADRHGVGRLPRMQRVTLDGILLFAVRNESAIRAGFGGTMRSISASAAFRATKSAVLRGEHTLARRELDALLSRKEKIAAFKKDAEDLLISYATAIPKRLRKLGSEERHRVYGMLKARARARCDGGLELSGGPLYVSHLHSFTNREDSRESAWRVKGALNL